MTRGEIVPNTIPPLGSMFAVAVLGWRRDRDGFRWSCNEDCQRSPRETRAGPRLRSEGVLGRASSRSSTAAPIIQSSSINRRTVCISLIGRESHRGG
jgi:hypothetical protein